MKIKITQIDIKFGKGSFADFANLYEEQNESDITRWEIAYNGEVKKELERRFPFAVVDVGEGYEQMMNSKYYVDSEEVNVGDFDFEYTDDDMSHYLAREETEFIIQEIVESVANNGTFWD